MSPRRTALRALTALSALAATAAALVFAPAGPAAASEIPLSPTDLTVQTNLLTRALDGALGPDLAGLVTDAATGQVLWSQTETEAQIPASNTKILTAVNTLEAFGPTHRFTTRVMTGVTPRRVVLVGGGDPSLTSRQLGQLARTVAAGVTAQGLRRVRVQVDDSLFPAPTSAPGWRRSYTINDVSPVRALVVDHRRRWDTALDAGTIFARKLERWGLRVRSVTRGVRPATSTELATSLGVDVGAQVTRMLQLSDNDVAEGLHRLVALQTGHPATWEGARAAQAAGAARLGVTLSTTVRDGSGLSRANRLTPADLVAVLARAFDGQHPNLAGLTSGAFPVAGVSGTLGPRYLRFVTDPTRCATGLVEAKTGSLSGVISLSGFARGADGQVKLFSFLLNRVPSTLATRRAVDRLAATVTGCW